LRRDSPRSPARAGGGPGACARDEHLALAQDTGRLDDRIERLSGLLERMLTSMDGLASSVEALQGAVGPMGRLASRLPGQQKGT